jgi:AcrR family transcriptional regulator
LAPGTATADVEATTPRARRSHTERRDEAERRLYDAALTLVAERGLERVTLTEVGEAAGYSRGLPAHYFGSKAGMVVALAERVVEDFGRGLARLERRPPGLARLMALVRFYLDSARRDPVRARALQVLLGEGLGNPLIRAPIARLNARSVEAIGAYLAAAVAAGEARADLDVTAQAELILATMRGAVGLWLAAPGEVDLARLGEALAQSLERSLKP